MNNKKIICSFFLISVLLVSSLNVFGIASRGQEGGQCYRGTNTCNSGLICQSGFCVKSSSTNAQGGNNANTNSGGSTPNADITDVVSCTNDASCSSSGMVCKAVGQSDKKICVNGKKGISHLGGDIVDLANAVIELTTNNFVTLKNILLGLNTRIDSIDAKVNNMGSIVGSGGASSDAGCFIKSISTRNKNQADQTTSTFGVSGDCFGDYPVQVAIASNINGIDDTNNILTLYAPANGFNWKSQFVTTYYCCKGGTSQFTFDAVFKNDDDVLQIKNSNKKPTACCVLNKIGYAYESECAAHFSATNNFWSDTRIEDYGNNVYHLKDSDNIDSSDIAYVGVRFNNNAGGGRDNDWYQIRVKCTTLSNIINQEGLNNLPIGSNTNLDYADYNTD